MYSVGYKERNDRSRSFKVIDFGSDGQKLTKKLPTKSLTKIF